MAESETKERFSIEPDGTRVCRLHVPMRAHGGRTIDVVRLRPPKYRDIMSFGDPAAMIVFNGAILPHEDMGIIEKYLNALLLDDKGEVIDTGLLAQVDYRDALALKDAVLSFFKAAA
ncbi:hypothetical protein NB311A_05053 [Nitrobacter sp. Nb-311A]|uniref:hypothetical protein n=1 Tax=Nitrobacter sp. Nb-311A TaxID=314253 RepID=UPI00006870A4|nr:hypothetical protein [Nitrobacter sp. Nb-311A]EAQ35757.1 hypothetical protein NB311A_05053 [Nitrobacter sp. Nb-311A]